MNNRDPLSDTLKSWCHQPSPVPDFAKTVWARIDATEQAPAPSFFARLLRFPLSVPLPLAASVAITFSIFVGTLGALAVSRSQSADHMATAYVHSIDPLQMTADHVHLDSHS